MSDHTAATMTVDAPENNESKIAVRQDWTPAVFEAEVEKEKQMRGILQKYMKDAMIKDHHYYSFKEGDKPALSQEGAHSICSLMKCVIGPPELREVYHEGSDHYSVTARVEIYNQQGERVATGDGSCSTRESKYAYRWVWDNEVPNGVDKSTLKSKSGTKKSGGSWTQYQMPNQDLPDLYNTVLKMSVKRAKVAAVRQLPLVSELFVADDDDDSDVGDRGVSNSRTNRETSHAKGNSKAPAPPPAQQQTANSVQTAVDLAKKLVENHDVEMEDLVQQFLPDDIGRFEDLSEETAAGIAPLLVNLINSKLEEKRHQK